MQKSLLPRLGGVRGAAKVRSREGTAPLWVSSQGTLVPLIQVKLQRGRGWPWGESLNFPNCFLLTCAVITSILSGFKFLCLPFRASGSPSNRSFCLHTLCERELSWLAVLLSQTSLGPLIYFRHTSCP